MTRPRRTPILTLLVFLPFLTACDPLSRSVRSPAAGWNGGFESEDGGLPVNWMLYAPDTVPGARFRVSLDREEHVEGDQSLRFSVDECRGDGGRLSPGLAREWVAGAGRRHSIAFSIRSSGADWVASFGSTSAKEGTYRTASSTGRAADQWHRITLPIELADGHDRLRFELSIRSAGDVWIDDVTVEPAP